MMRLLKRLGVSVATAFAVAMAIAIIAALVELYLTGHAYGSITREVITWPAAGVHLSIADTVLLLAAMAAGVLTWLFSPFGRP